MEKENTFKTVHLFMDTDSKLKLKTDKKTIPIDEVNEIIDHMSTLAVIYAADRNKKLRFQLTVSTISNIIIALIALVSIFYL